MDKVEAQLWKRVDDQLDRSSTEKEHRLEVVRDRLDEISGDADRIEAVAAEVTRSIKVHRVDYPPQSDLDVEIEMDSRAHWNLVGNLDAAELAMQFSPEVQRRIRPWKPAWAEWVSWPLGDSASRQAEVTLHFDYRLSQRELVAHIRRMWPMFRERGFIRQTRPLKSKAIALVRLICLDLPPGTTWAERLGVWRKRYGRREGRYGGVYPFQRDFRRAERQLTGQHYGLEHFYNPMARLRDDELTERCERGDREALQYRNRLRARNTQRALASRRVDQPSENTEVKK